MGVAEIETFSDNMLDAGYHYFPTADLAKHCLSVDSSSKPLLIEQLSKFSGGVSWHVGFTNSLLLNSPFL